MIPKSGHRFPACADWSSRVDQSFGGRRQGGQDHASSTMPSPWAHRPFPARRRPLVLTPMNRTGLVAALLIGLCVGVVFGVYPRLDIAISRLFFDETFRVFPTVYSLTARYLREVFNWTTALLVAPAFVALIAKIVLPRRRM